MILGKAAKAHRKGAGKDCGEVRICLQSHYRQPYGVQASGWQEDDNSLSQWRGDRSRIVTEDNQEGFGNQQGRIPETCIKDLVTFFRQVRH